MVEAEAETPRGDRDFLPPDLVAREAREMFEAAGKLAGSYKPMGAA
jgi:hypothetical protein